MLTMTDAPQITKPPATGRKRARAILLSDRIDTTQLEHNHVVSTVPLTYKFGKDGFVTLFRYGVAVTIGLTPEEEDEVLRGLKPRLIRPVQPREEEVGGNRSHPRQGRSNSARRPDRAEGDHAR